MENITTQATNTCDQPSVAVDFDSAIKLIGDFWTLRIVDSLHDAELRFCEIERALPSINPATLTTRLKRLEEAEVIQRHLETRDKQSVTYSLTEKGEGILPVLDSIKNFTDTFMKRA